MANKTRKLVLAVERDSEVLNKAAELLSLFQYAYVGIRGRFEADAIILRNCPDVLIVTLGTEDGETGTEYAQRLKDSGIDCPIIAISDQPTVLAAAEASGVFTACFSKPIDVANLITKVQELASQS